MREHDCPACLCGNLACWGQALEEFERVQTPEYEKWRAGQQKKDRWSSHVGLGHHACVTTLKRPIFSDFLRRIGGAARACVPFGEYAGFGSREARLI